MQNVRKRREGNTQVTMPVKKWLGMNTGTLETLGDGESASLQNVNLFSSPNGDYLESRLGSQYLKAASGATKYGAGTFANLITWDIGADEYLISQIGTAVYAQNLTTPANAVAVALATGGAFALGASTRADMFISGDKLYLMHASGNYTIRWTGSVFVAYPMGLAYPWILAITSATTGVISGSYTLGIEKVYQASGVDLMASTPNRRIPTTRILAQTGTIALKKIKFTIQATELDNDSLWTHLRVWRSKNKNDDNTDPLNPIDAQGLDDELYEEALITRAEIGAGSLTAIATGSTLPLGNAGTTAGKPASVYTVELNNLDAVLFNLIGLDRIELLPIPASTMGCFCANRIFFAGVQDATLGDASKNNIWYSNYAGTKYAFQYNPLNFVDTGRDGQGMVKLIAFEKDVIGIKEAKTGRIPSGNVDIPFQVLDERIGVPHIKLATFVPGVGIVGITSDNGDFRVFGYDLRWTGTLNGMDVSKPVRSLTRLFPGYVASGLTFSMEYFNGRIYILTINSICLHVREGKGWTYTNWLNNYYSNMFVFAGGSRAAIASPNSHLIEVEVSGVTTDINANTDSASTINCEINTPVFKSNGGRDIIEAEYLSVEGLFPSGSIYVYPLINGMAWPDPNTSTPTAQVPNAGSIGGSFTELRNREYRCYIQPQTVGVFKWCPMVGNFLSYKISCAGPLRIDSVSLSAVIDQNGMAWGAFDPLQQFPTTNTDPTWAQ